MRRFRNHEFSSNRIKYRVRYLKLINNSVKLRNPTQFSMEAEEISNILWQAGFYCFIVCVRRQRCVTSEFICRGIDIFDAITGIRMCA